MALIDVVKYGGGPDDIIWKFPSDSLSTATQVIVNENMEAVFFREGKALDVLGPGRHTLTTGNIPILEKIINLPFGGETPFTAEIYYVQKKVFTDLKWGTPTPILIEDKKYGVPMEARAFGKYSIRVKDSRIFVNSIVGGEQRFTTKDIIDFLKSIILTRLTDAISEFLENVSILKINSYLNELSTLGKSKLSSDFEKYGLEIVDFLVNSVSVPDEIKEILRKKAELGILGKDYDRMRMFDAMQAAAENPGGGGMTGAGVGLGMGFGLGQMIPGMMQNVMGGNQQQPQQPPQQPQQNQQPAGGVIVCPKCGMQNPQGAKFCSNCGTPLGAVICPNCGHQNPPGAKFCSNCGTKLS